MTTLQKNFPVVEVNLKKLRQNIDEVVSRCNEKGIMVAGVVKGFNGIVEATRQFEESNCSFIGSSRLEHLKEAKDAGMKGPFMVVRIPMLSEVPDLVKFADISLNSEIEVIKEINAECARQGKKHSVILMADLGDLREGFWDKEAMAKTAVYIEKNLENVTLAGVGTNLGCYGSINPTIENMNQLIAIAETIEKEIGRTLSIISGGGTTSLPLVLDGTMPERINHLRIGEGISLGKDLQDLWGLDMSYLHPDVFTAKAEIIEVKDKPSYPVGEIFVDCFGNKGEYVDRGIRKRALLGLGKLDFAMSDMLIPREKGIEVLGGSSDHLIVDIEEYQGELKVGDFLEFDVRYATMMYLTASKYVRIECK
ncbi:alanine racemase [Anaerovorax sp. IOR16]|uniref:alanine racemase n=1 Tax=Anaerovorax sp. IOR16 TaxID=2773458 RepID=UPI0019D00C47|nr:alanine/ornithine racemase family PLP-dependent enzyme [Anaerovorax sp. IOR16]